MSKERLNVNQEDPIAPLGVRKETWLKTGGWVIGMLAFVKLFTLINLPSDLKLTPSLKK